MAKLGVLLPEPTHHESSELLIPIPKGPDVGQDLATTKVKTPESLARNASRRLWEREELKNHMLSPKRAKLSRSDFSPERKNCYKSKTLSFLFINFRYSSFCELERTI